MVFLRILLALSVIHSVSAGGTASSTMILDFANYGIDTADACPSGDVNGAWYVDRTFNSICFSRLVQCDGSGNVIAMRECENGYIFIGDGDSTTCYEATSSAAYDACELTVECGLDGITVTVTSGAVFDQVDAPLQFGTSTSALPNCQIAYNSGDGVYQGFMSFDPDYVGATTSECIPAPSLATDTDGDGYHITYEFEVMRYVGRNSFVFDASSTRVEEEDVSTGVVITREKCFMATAVCSYNPDGTVTASYTPSSPNALDEHDNSTLEFEMIRVDCDDRSDMTSAEAALAVFVEEPVCFQNRITTSWHTGIRISSTLCWTSDTADDPDSSVYYLGDINESVLDNTFFWMCPNDDTNDNVYEQTFQFEAFRYQQANIVAMQDSANYDDQIYVWCDVNACATTDTSSDDCIDVCADGDGATFNVDVSGRRRRRDAYSNALLPQLTKRRTMSKLFVRPAEEKRINTIEAPTYSFLSDTLSLGLFAVGCVFGIVALAMFISMRRQRNQMKAKYGMLYEH